ncbi:MAG TPA: DUF1385 domain-containing protein [Clostridiaceae bacterium]|nr:DUF1385 domain-containing protein [Clostridiaceae bacterium]
MKKTSIGGQALIEGLLMIGPENTAVAIRKPDGEIIVNKSPLQKKSKISKIPVIRGGFNLIRQMVIGVKALMYSAEFYELGEEDDKKSPSKFQKFLEDFWGGRIKKAIDKLDKLLENKFQDIAIYMAVILSVALSVGLFILIPNIIAGFFKFNKDTFWGVVLYNLIEGLLRVTIFLGYIIMASRLKDIKRIWEYHGAEHKTIHCYENEEELTVENVKKYSTKHPRCGTSFMFLVIIVSILVFSFVGWHSMFINIIMRILLIPLVAGLAYEAVKFAGRCEWKIAGIINAPGMMFQLFTTKEPDDKQIEVAIEALKNVLVEDKEADKW